MNDEICKICGSKKEKIFNKKILGKYEISYFKCSNCGFVQTEKPYWLEESYSSAITSLDIGLVNRNIQYSNIVEGIIYNNFNEKAKFLDFAGGYGMFTRIMRDKGFDYYHEDKYCENIFAKFFSIEDLKKNDRFFELVTSFELMEHIEDPFRELDYIFSQTDNFLFSTEILPKENFENWWYLGEEHGQHISFYTTLSIEKIAERYKKYYYPNGPLHLFSKKKLRNPFNSEENTGFLEKVKFLKKKEKEKLISKTQLDFDMIKKIQNEKNVSK